MIPKSIMEDQELKDQLNLAFDTLPKTRRTQGGETTSRVITSCHLGDNSGIFPQILDLHVAKGSVVADITYGRGVFWKNVPRGDYTLLASDLKLGTAWDNLPHGDQTVDAIVFDPPYMEGLYRTTKNALAGSGTHQAFQDAYSNGETQTDKQVRKYHDAVLLAYLSVLPEVKRLLRP